MTTTKTSFAMYTAEGNEQIKKLADQFLNEQTITPFHISQVVYDFGRWVIANHEAFATKHSEFDDTAVREELHVYFDDTLRDGFYKFISGPRA